MARTTGSYNHRTVAPSLQRVWQSMRIYRSRFTTADLITTARAGESVVAKYVRALAQAGYLRLVQARVSGRPGSRDVWCLVRGLDSPVAPIRRWDGSGVYDPNTLVVWGLDGLPQAKPTDHDGVARALLAKLRDQTDAEAAAS